MLERTRYFTYLLISLWKITLFFLGAWLIVSLNGVLQDPLNLFNKFRQSFNEHAFNVTENVDVIIDGVADDATIDAYDLRVRAILYTIGNSPVWVLLIQMGSSYLAYIFSKFACKVQIQGFSFSLPLSAVVPTCATLLLAACGARVKDKCAFHGFLPDYQFFECPTVGDYFRYIQCDRSTLI
jgi:chitin synthase